jgi:hypothetical protein
VQQQISSSHISQELCRVLQDHQQQCPQVKQMLVMALSGLLQDACTALQGAQLLCILASEVFPEQQQQQRQQVQRTKQQQQQQQQGARLASNPEAAVAAAAAAHRDTVLLQLDLITLVLTAEPAAAAGFSRDGMSCHQQTALLAAAMLPVLVPAALMTNAAVRRLWLLIASTAAAAAAYAGPATAAAAAAAMDAHSAGVAALASAARWDKDANVRSKALTLLADAVPCLWLQLVMRRRMDAEQQQQRAANDQESHTTEAASENKSSTSSRSFCTQLHSSCCAMIAALQAQLTGSSKACRAKALHLLQQLLSDPSEVLAAAAAQQAQQQQRTYTSASTSSCKQFVVKWQQQLVADTFPCLAALLAAPQDSPLHCPASKAAAEQLLPCMAQLLQPHQALQLALSCSAVCGGSSGAAAAGQLLASLSQCSEAEVYAVLRQQLTAGGRTCTPGEQQQGGMLCQLQHLLAAGSCCSEPLRRHAFLKVCETLNDAADSCRDTEAGHLANQQQQQQHSMHEPAAQLLLSVQLLELCCGCSSPLQEPKDFRGELAILADALDWCCLCMQSTAAAAAAAAAAGRAAAGEIVEVVMVTVTPAEDDRAGAVLGVQLKAVPVQNCGAEAADVAVVMEDVEQPWQQSNQQQDRQLQQQQQKEQQLAATFSSLQELLASLLRILYKAAEAAAAASSKQAASASNPAAGLAAGSAANSGVSCMLPAGLGSTLLHHLELVVSLAACGAESAGVLPAQLPVEVLGHYIQVNVLHNIIV